MLSQARSDNSLESANILITTCQDYVAFGIHVHYHTPGDLEVGRNESDPKTGCC
jgi:hypothetical protein